MSQTIADKLYGNLYGGGEEEEQVSSTRICSETKTY